MFISFNTPSACTTIGSYTGPAFDDAEYDEDLGYLLPIGFREACIQVRPGLDSVGVEKALFLNRPEYIATQGESEWRAFDPNQLLEFLKEEADVEAAPDMYFALQQIIADLPARRDWLSPDLERIAKEALAKAEGVKA